MSTEPRTRLPLAGLLIVFVAPLASLLVIVPSLFAATVAPNRSGVSSAISRILSSLPTTRHEPPGGAVARVPAPEPSIVFPPKASPAAPAAPGPPATAALPEIAAPALAGAGVSGTNTVATADQDDRGRGRGDRDDKPRHQGPQD